MNDLVIGIDGGGSRTRACLANLRGETLVGTGEAGTSNPVGGGLDATKRALAQAVRQAFDAARLEPQRVAAVCIGLGGAGRTHEQEELVKWVIEAMAERARVLNDGEIALAATSENWGVALIAGTGSLAWGRNHAGQTARAGGWGYVLGDEGSGFDLARQALRAITQAADGRAEPTKLCDAVLRLLNLSSPTELVAHVYGQPLRPAEIARLAPLVIDVADRGDPVAQRLVQQAGVALATAACAVSRALGLAHPIPLALTGGLLLGAPLLRTHLLEALSAQGCECSPVILVDQPVMGAVRLARELAVQESK